MLNAKGENGVLCWLDRRVLFLFLRSHVFTGLTSASDVRCTYDRLVAEISYLAAPECVASTNPAFSPSVPCRWHVVWAVCSHLQCPDVRMYGSGQTFALTLYYFVGSVLFGLYVCSHLQRSYVCMYVCMYGSVQTYALTL